MSKIPKKAKQIFKGEIFDVYQWPQKMFDGSTATFEMLKRPYTVQIIAVQNKKIIVGEEQQPNLKRGLSLFGGRVDKNEKTLAAAKRELLEESGMKSSDWELLFKNQPINKIDWEISYYIARDCQTIAKQNLDGGEKIKITTLSFEEFVEYWSQDYRNSWLSYYLLKLKNDGKLKEFKKQLFKK